MNRIIGIGILLLIFGGLFDVVVVQIGIIDTILVFATAISLTALVALAVYLMFKDEDTE